MEEEEKKPIQILIDEVKKAVAVFEASSGIMVKQFDFEHMNLHTGQNVLTNIRVYAEGKVDI